jgi:hypothetical protein
MKGGREGRVLVVKGFGRHRRKGADWGGNERVGHSKNKLPQGASNGGTSVHSSQHLKNASLLLDSTAHRRFEHSKKTNRHKGLQMEGLPFFLQKCLIFA